MCVCSTSDGVSRHYDSATGGSCTGGHCGCRDAVLPHVVRCLRSGDDDGAEGCEGEIEGQKPVPKQEGGAQVHGAARKVKSSKVKSSKSKPAQAPASDRTALLADAERLENLDHARGMRAALRYEAGEHLHRRPVQGRVPCDLPEQPDAGHRRSGRAGRPADLGLRVGSDPAVSRTQDRQILSQGRACAGRGRSMADVADGRPRSDGRAGASLPRLRAGAACDTRSTATPTRSIGSTAS